MLTDLNSQMGVKLVIASIAVAFALLLFFLIARAWRKRGSRRFVLAGRNRGPRLAVVDSTTVDQRRRLVLVRRDDIEHLILTGGPSDLVIESGIGAVAAAPSRTAAETAGPVEDTAPVNPATAAAARQEAENVETPAAAVESHEPAREPVFKAPAGAAQASADAAPAQTAGAPSPRVDVDELFENHRERVFGPSGPGRENPEQPASAYVRAYTGDDMELPGEPRKPSEAGTGPAPDRPSVVRFEDFLDSEVESDLSQVRPNERSAAAPPRSVAPVAPPPQGVPQQPAAPVQDRLRSSDDRALSEEMSRLLSELSHKR